VGAHLKLRALYRERRDPEDDDKFSTLISPVLANKAHFLYFTRKQAERGRLLKSVLLNCDTDAVSFVPTYRKPFDLIFQRAKNEEWSGREDLNLQPPGPEATTETLSH